MSTIIMEKNALNPVVVPSEGDVLFYVNEAGKLVLRDQNGVEQVFGDITVPIYTISTSGQVITGTGIYLVDTTAGPVNVQLPAPSLPTRGTSFNIIKNTNDANAVTITAIGGALIGGQTSQTIVEPATGVTSVDNQTGYVITQDSRGSDAHIQDAYDNSPQPQIVTSAERGAFQFKAGYAGDQFQVVDISSQVQANIDQYGNVTSRARRTNLSGTTIDFSQADAILFKTLTSNTTLTITNPKLDKIIALEIEGNYTLTLPSSVKVINGNSYDGLSVNAIYIHCIDEATPKYWATINQEA